MSATNAKKDLATCGTICGNCNQHIPNAILESYPNGMPACPHCGSLTMRYELAMHPEATVTAVDELTGAFYPEILIGSAEDLISQEKWGIAVIVIHMACEIAVEKSMSAAFKKDGIERLEEPVLEFLNGYSLRAVKNRSLYTALTGDEIQKESFWEGYLDSAKARNDAVHGGYLVKEGAARASLKACTEFVRHVQMKTKW